MHNRFLSSYRASCSAALLVVVGILDGSAAGFTPESPEVKDAVAKALTFLESEAADDHQLGAKALVGMTFVKCGKEPDHPRILEALKAVRVYVGNHDPKRLERGDKSIYHAGLVAMFLIAHDRDTHEADIDCVLKYLQSVQKDHGGWGYPTWQTGDTSMTQYGVLSAWEATKLGGFRIPDETVVKMAGWLLKTQDPSGGFAYQGKASSSFALIAQDKPSRGMTAAALGSVYIAADLLGLIGEVKAPDDDVPAALQVVKEKQPGGAAASKSPLAVQQFAAAESSAMGWLGKNYDAKPPAQYPHYYLYALERSMGFRDLWNGKAHQKPRDDLIWYNDGVKLLLETQGENGGWDTTCGEAAGTAFAVLFLIRSTLTNVQKSRNFGDGTMVMGRTLPNTNDNPNVHVRDGQVVVKPLVSAADELLDILENTATADYSRAAGLVADLPPDRAQEVVRKHAEKLRSLVADKSPQARMAAVRALSRTGGLDNVPTLIYALTDPDTEIVNAARDGLRRISRKPAGFGLANNPSETGLRVAVEKWKTWYLMIRPDAELEN